MSEDYFKKNCESLDFYFSSLVQRLNFIPNEDSSFHIVRAKDGSSTIKVISNQGREKYLHSFYNPSKEGDVLAKRVYFKNINLFILFGFGLGYQGINLFNRLGPEQKMLIIEPHPFIFKKALSLMDFSFLFNDKRVFIIVDERALCVKQKIKTFLNDFIPYDATTIRYDFLSLYERWDRYKSFEEDIKLHLKTTLNDLYEVKKNVISQIDYLRTSGLGKSFFGNYKECISFFRERFIKGISLNDAELGMLITYFLFSYESYAETFEKGSRL